ncbi:MAG: DUF4135 domain-containing protein [Pseudobdellovibrionaceae bacterium]
MIIKKILGDRHNSGKSVCLLDDNSIYKPRPILAEWFFLNRESPLRSLKEINSVFKYFPNIDFTGLIRKDGVVSNLYLNYSDINFPTSSDELCEAIGCLLAISHWFGLSDLHVENIFFGYDEHNNLLLAPIDIECFFQEILIIAQTNLIKIERDDLNWGLKNVFEAQSISPIHIVHNYIKHFLTLNSNSEKIISIIRESFKPNDIVRVILKNSAVYRDYLDDNYSDSTFFIQEEVNQLAKGDVPYFFRYLDGIDIFYYYDGMPSRMQTNLNESTFIRQVDFNKFVDIVKNERENSLKINILHLSTFLLRNHDKYSELYIDTKLEKYNSMIYFTNIKWKIKCSY